MRLDPRGPLVVDTRELGRRPGMQRQSAFEAPAPEDLGIEVLAVPVGAPIDFELRLEAVMEGVLVTGTAVAELRGECVRCLDELNDEIRVNFCDLYVYDDVETDADEDEETRRLEGDLIDLEPLVRDAVVLALPFQPVCQPDCPGLCPDCGEKLAQDPDHQHEEKIDPRWASLQGLTKLAETDR